MKNLIRLFTFLLISLMLNLSCFAQYYRAYIYDNDGRIHTEPIPYYNKDIMKSQSKEQSEKPDNQSTK